MSEYKSFNSPQEVARWVICHYSNAEICQLDVRENADSPLGDYKGNAYSKINYIVRHSCEKNQKLYDIEGIQSLLLSHKVPEDIIATRYVDWNELLILLWNTRWHRTYIYPQFLSTTLLRNAFSMDYLKKGRIPISIQIPKGTYGAFLPEVNPDSPEFEVLLPYRMHIMRIKWNLYRIENG